jgi:hypothetical protein
VKITKRQLRKIIREAVGDQLPYSAGGPWVDKDAPVGKGASQYDHLDQELTDEEMDTAGYYNENNYPLTIGYTDDGGKAVKAVINNDEESEEFFHEFFATYGMSHPYSVDGPGTAVTEAVGYYSDEDMPEAWHAGYDDALNGDSPISVDQDYEDGFEAGIADSQSPSAGSELEVGADLVAGTEERLRDWGY